MSRRQPNILLLLADQHRVESMGYAGGPDVRTPNFDRMAAEGTNFTHAVSTHPVCSPHRACVQTGLYGFQNGVVWNEDDIDRSLANLAGTFDAAGYATGYFGKCHWHGKINNSLYTPPPWRLGWKHWVGWHNGHNDYDMPTFDADGAERHDYVGRFVPEVQTELLIDWVNQQGDRPWIAQVNWGPPHNVGSCAMTEELVERSKRLNEALGLGIAPELFATRLSWIQTVPLSLLTDVAPQRFFDMYPREELVVPPNVREGRETLVRYHLQEYYAQISALDELAGRIMDWLIETGRAEDTIVLYSADHGDYVGSHRAPRESIRSKCQPYQCSARVPMLVWGPGRVVEGVACDAPMSTIDLLPTLCGLAGLDAPDEKLPGMDLSPWAFTGGGDRPGEALLILQTWRALYDGRYMYAVMGHDHGVVPWLLFDTAADPYDLNNLLETDGGGELAVAMHRRLTEALRNVGEDPAYVAAMEASGCGGAFWA